MAINSINNRPRVFTASGAQPKPPAAPDSVQIAHSPQPEPEPQPDKKKWTVMIWSASDNNLYRFMQDDLDEAERVGTTPELSVVAQTDHHPIGGTAKRYELVTNSDPGFGSPAWLDMGQANEADPHQLADFIKWSQQTHPAEHYMLIVSDHGAGWKGACQDRSANAWMKLPDIEAGLKEAREATGNKLDVLGFDACLMAGAESAAQFKDEASYLVASQETEGGAGWQYNRVLSDRMLNGAQMAMTARLNFEPRDMATNVVTMAQGVQGDLATMAAYDLSKAPALETAIDGLGKAIISSQVDNQVFTKAAEASQGFYEYKDLGDFANKVSAATRGKDRAVADAAAAVNQAISDMIVAEQHSENYPDAHGVSIELNKDYGERGIGFAPNMRAEESRGLDFGKYADTKLAQETSWADAVNKFRS